MAFTIHDFSQWVYDKFYRTRILESSDIMPVKKSNGIELHFIGELDNSSSGDTYNGPFKVVKKDASTVTIKAYDGSKYYAHNYIIAGLSRIESAADVDVTITVTGSVYAKVIYSASVYSVTYHNEATLPSQVDGEYYFELAAIDFTDSKAIVKQQVQYGYINISGRVV